VWSGTSFASPHVAGVAALYLAANPSATPSQVSAAILGSAASNLVGSVGAGTPNLLLQSGVVGGATTPPPTDTTSTPPPPPPTSTPTATFTVNGCPRSNCTFDGSGSTSPNGIASFAWNFGDGGASSASGSTMKVSHAYASRGTYTVTLTVVDKAGQSASIKQTVTIKR
jgi:PKD repeat protein